MRSYRPTNEPQNGTEAKLTLEWEQDGHRYFAHGKVVDHEFRQWIEEESYSIAYTGRYYLTFKPEDDGTYIRVEKKEISPMKIIHTAEVDVDDLTVEALNAAREAVDCPENAQFNVFQTRGGGYERGMVEGEKRPATITFRWTDG